MLGGAADRAQLVIDLIDELLHEADGLDTLADEAGTAIDGVDHATTPEANIAQLEIVVERVTTTKDATAAVVGASDDAIDETHGHLAGSSRADDIAGQIEEARDELEQSRTDLDGLAEEAKAQQEAYREIDRRGWPRPDASPATLALAAGTPGPDLRPGRLAGGDHQG